MQNVRRIKILSRSQKGFSHYHKYMPAEQSIVRVLTFVSNFVTTSRIILVFNNLLENIKKKTLILQSNKNCLILLAIYYVRLVKIRTCQVSQICTSCFEN